MLKGQVIAGNDCYVHFALLFNAIVVHGNLPDNFLYSTIIPIPKGRNANSCDSSNYRGIALSSIFSKVFDNLVLLKSLMNFLLAIYNLVLSLGVLPICVVLY